MRDKNTKTKIRFSKTAGKYISRIQGTRGIHFKELYENG